MIPDPNKPYQTVESVTVNKASFVCDLRDYGEGPRLVLVLTRGNSRAFDYGTARFLQLLRAQNVTVLVNVAGVDIPLEQFETSGVWGVRKSQTVQAPQGRYNMTSELNRLRGELVSMRPDDPRYTYNVARINQLDQMLNTAQPRNTMEIESTLKSRSELENLAESLQREAFDKFLQIPDEELATYDFDKLSTLGITKNTKQWSAVVTRWSSLRNKKGDNNAS